MVTDEQVLTGNAWESRAAQVLEEGRDAVALHVRGPSLQGRRVFELTREILSVSLSKGSVVVVNDRVDVALALGVSWVHLPVRSLPVAAARSVLGRQARIGASVRLAHHRACAEVIGPDYMVAGTVYASTSHPGRNPDGLEALQGVVDGCALPVLGIGGITARGVPGVMGSGAHGVAVLSAVWGADRPGLAVRELLQALDAKQGTTTREGA